MKKIMTGIAVFCMSICAAGLNADLLEEVHETSFVCDPKPLIEVTPWRVLEGGAECAGPTARIHREMKCYVPKFDASKGILTKVSIRLEDVKAVTIARWCVEYDAIVNSCIPYLGYDGRNAVDVRIKIDLANSNQYEKEFYMNPIYMDAPEANIDTEVSIGTKMTDFEELTYCSEFVGNGSKEIDAVVNSSVYSVFSLCYAGEYGRCRLSNITEASGKVFVKYVYETDK